MLSLACDTSTKWGRFALAEDREIQVNMGGGSFGCQAFNGNP